MERFADLGITAGCRTEPLGYCPERVVNRAQMATFLQRALRLPEAAPAGFDDTEGNTHEDNIDALAAEGITAGCATEPLLYCPDDPVNRAQMATFLSRALGLIPLPSAEALSAQEVYAKVAPSIPIVESAYGQGSGILIPGDYVLTNHHVVWPDDFIQSATIVFPDGTEYSDVEVVATNPWADLAVLGPLETDKRPLPLADGEQLPPGSDLYLIGYSAEYEQDEGFAPEPTITRGLLSRVRHWDGYDMTLLQTDAAIAGGQSGGALVDSRGRVVGVPTWSWSDAGFSVATSASDDAEVVELMLTDDSYSHSFLDSIDASSDPSRTWDIELGGAWDLATFVVQEIAESISLEVEGSGEAYAWLADAFDVLCCFDAEGGLADRGDAEILTYGTYFVEIGQVSAGPGTYTLTSSAELWPYYDEDGVVLLAEGETSGGNAGVFDYDGDVDAYELHLRRGETVVIWTDSIDSDTRLFLYDSASNVVAEDDDSGPIGVLGFEFNAEILFEAPATGTYYINMYVADGATGGSYIINAAIVE
ncbi:MAG: trypsin-like peptidase domain-containing protein [Acidimicrobiia bacterium]|nr:trypsin-like peptidase domain-containing protein [Acidimicrobiia bacterium]